MIKYLEPREFYCAVITAFIGPFSLCLRGHLCLLSAQSRLKWFQLLLQKGCLWGVKISEICGGAEKEGQQHGWRDSAYSQLQRAKEQDGGLTWRDLEQIQLQKQFMFLENRHKNEEGKRRAQPGTGNALKSPWSLSKWALFFLRAASLTSQSWFCTGKSNVKTSSPEWEGSVGVKNLPA